MSRKKSDSLTVKGPNSIIKSLSSQLKTLEVKYKKAEEQNKELNSVTSLLTEEVQTKAIEITQLKTENKNLKEKLSIFLDNQNNENELNKQLKNNIDKSMEQSIKLQTLIREKMQLEKEKEEMEKKYLDIKTKYENEVKNNVFLKEKNKILENDKIKLTQELKYCNEQLKNKDKILEENELKLQDMLFSNQYY